MAADVTRRLRQEICASTLSAMSMTQLIIGTALGFFVAQGVLYGISILSAGFSAATRASGLSADPSLGSAFISAFIKYAAPVGAGAAVITLCVWAVGDNLARGPRAARRRPTSSKRSTLVPASGLACSSDELARPVSTSRSTALATESVDPYADSDFKVQRRSHRPGSALSLKETLLQRSEAKACAELLRQTQQHLSRSQYDCEVADRAGKYLKPGLTSGASQRGKSGTSRWTATRAPCSPVQGHQGYRRPLLVGGFAVDRRAAASPVICALSRSHC